MASGEEYPKKGAYRGISSKGFFTNAKRTLLKSDVFQFDTVKDRTTDDSTECSINWADDEGALLQIARQKTARREGGECFQFAGGACRVALDDLELVKKSYDRLLSWERRPTPATAESCGNPYHGNLLSIPKSKGDTKSLIRELRSSLATIASKTEIVLREQLDALILPATDSI